MNKIVNQKTESELIQEINSFVTALDKFNTKDEIANYLLRTLSEILRMRFISVVEKTNKRYETKEISL